MRRMKFVCALACVALLMPGCAKKDKAQETSTEAVTVPETYYDITVSPETTTEEEVYTKFPEEETINYDETPEYQESFKKLVGEVKDGVYANEFFGISVNIDETWKFYTISNLYEEWEKNYFVGEYTDLYVTNSDSTLNCGLSLSWNKDILDIVAYEKSFVSDYMAEFENQNYVVGESEDVDLSTDTRKMASSVFEIKDYDETSITYCVFMEYKDEFIYKGLIAGYNREEVLALRDQLVK